MGTGKISNLDEEWIGSEGATKGSHITYTHYLSIYQKKIPHDFSTKPETPSQVHNLVTALRCETKHCPVFFLSRTAGNSLQAHDSRAPRIHRMNNTAEASEGRPARIGTHRPLSVLKPYLDDQTKPLPPAASHLSFDKFFAGPLPILTVITNESPLSFNYFGIDDDSVYFRMMEYLRTKVSGNIDIVLGAFWNRVREFHFNPEHVAYWLTIQIWSKPTHEFDLPRWHQDGYYWYPAEDGKVYKLGTVFTGPPTLFLEPTEHNFRIYNGAINHQHGNNDEERDMAMRTWLAEQFGYSGIVVQPGELARWTVGGGSAIIHSEPAITEPRIFISVLPGTEAQIRELAERRKRPFQDAISLSSEAG